MNKDKLYYIDKRDSKYIERKPIHILRYKNPRILFRDMSRWNSFSIDFSGDIYPLQSCLFITLKDRNHRKAFYYLGLLMSCITEFYHKIWAPVLKGGTFRYRPEYLSHIPIISYNKAEEVIREKIINRVDQILKLFNDLKDKLVIIQLFIFKPEESVNLIRKHIDPMIDFAITSKKIKIKLKKNIEVKIFKPLNHNKEKKVKEALINLVDNIEENVEEIDRLENELDLYVSKIYGVQKELSIINNFLERLVLWE